MQETSEATATQTPLAPLTAEVTEQVEPTTDAPLAPEPAPEAPEAPGPSPTKEEEPPFAVLKGQKIADEYELLDHDLVKPHLERQLRRDRETLQGQYDAAVKETKETLEAVNENRLFANYVGNLLQKMREEDLPGAEVLAEKFIGALQKKESYDKALSTAGMMNANKTVLETLSTTLGRREQDQFEDWKAQHRDATWKDIVDRYVELRAVTAKKPLQDEVTSLKAENEKLKQRLREGKGPDLERGTGGPMSREEEDKILLDPYSAPEKVREIMARRNAGG